MKGIKKTPKELEIEVRSPHFDLESDLREDWFDGSAFKTAFENAFSLLFPMGEKVFIESVRNFEDQISDPKLLKEMKAFYGQEGAHRKIHQQYNQILCELRGYDLAHLTKPQVERHQNRYSQLSPLQKLSATVAAEHLTAILADDLMNNKDHFADQGKSVVKLWYWHALEESEHKAVAFDLYTHIGGTLKGRRKALILATFFILRDTFRSMFIMLKKDGQLFKIKTWIDGINFLVIKPGILRRTFIPWLMFFKKDFHPWDNNNLDSIEYWKKQVPQKNTL
jgi:predicted metal-dependent hydrolase